MPDLNEFITTEEATETLKNLVEHVRCMIRKGSIAGVRISLSCLVKRTALDGFMQRISKMAKHDPHRNK